MKRVLLSGFVVFLLFAGEARSEPRGRLKPLSGKQIKETTAEDRVLEAFDARVTSEKYFKLSKKEKVKTIEKLIKTYKERSGIIIAKPAADYVNMMDYMVENNLALIDMPLGKMFKTVCELEDDFKKENAPNTR